MEKVTKKYKCIDGKIREFTTLFNSISPINGCSQYCEVFKYFGREDDLIGVKSPVDGFEDLCDWCIYSDEFNKGIPDNCIGILDISIYKNFPELFLKNNRPRLINPSNSYNCNN